MSTDPQAQIWAKAALDRTRGGTLTNGEWIKLPAIYALALGGTGTVSIDVKARDGTVTTGVASYSPAGSATLEYPFFGASAAYVRATLTGTATAEIG